MDTETQRRIEQRAYALWEAEGQPEGRDREHWYRAAEEIATQKGKPKRAARKPASSAAKPTRKKKRASA